jgi:steroid delta-isomerase-like uncharacterized protein
VLTSIPAIIVFERTPHPSRRTVPNSDIGALRAARDTVIREHMESENRLDFDATIATFDHPRYELVGTGQVFDGEEQVRKYYAASRAAFPDQRNEIHSLRHADDAVVVEFDLLGTHLGNFAGFDPTGRTFRCRMAAIFEFDGDRIVCERIYFDSGTILRQLGLIGGQAIPT